MKEETIIRLFCLIDNLLIAHFHKKHRQEVMSDAEVILAVILSSWLFAGNFRKGLAYLFEKKYFLKILSESRFIRRIHQIPHSSSR